MSADRIGPRDRLASSTEVHALDPEQGSEGLLVGARRAAELLAISPRTLWTHTASGAIPSRRIGRSVRYCSRELRAWVRAGCPTAPGSADAIRKAVGGE